MKLCMRRELPDKVPLLLTHDLIRLIIMPLLMIRAPTKCTQDGHANRFMNGSYL